jgi:hypothetical protein
MKKMILALALFLVCLAGSCQNADQTFEKIILVKLGVMYGDGSVQLKAGEPTLGNPATNGYLLSSTTAGVRSWVPPATGGSMTYPAAGIALSTGSAWGTSITNNSASWNTAYTWVNTNGANAVTAYSWGNHAGLYRPIAWVPTFAQITGRPTTLAGYGITDAALATHNHDLLYKPISYVPSYAEITNKPAELDLSTAIPSLTGIAVPRLTTVQIAAIASPVEGLLVYDLTLHVMKFWNGTSWKTIITNQ